MLTEISMMVNYLMIKGMEPGYLNIKMGIFILVNGKMIKEKAMDHLHLKGLNTALMDILIMVNGWMTLNMAMGYFIVYQMIKKQLVQCIKERGKMVSIMGMDQKHTQMELHIKEFFKTVINMGVE